MDHLGVLLAAANATRPDPTVPANQELKRAQREWWAKSREKRRKTHDGFTDRAWIVALMIYDLCNYAAGPAAMWLKKQYKRNTASFSLEELERLVEDWFISAPMAVIEGLSAEPDSVQRQHHVNEAQRVMREHKAVQYICDSNRRLGVAPSTRDVAEKLDELNGNTPDGPAFDPNTPRSHLGLRRNRLYMQRFRSKWKLKHGKIAARMAMTEGAVTAMALPHPLPGYGARGFLPIMANRALAGAVLGGVGTQRRQPGAAYLRASVSSA